MLKKQDKTDPYGKLKAVEESLAADEPLAGSPVPSPVGVPARLIPEGVLIPTAMPTVEFVKYDPKLPTGAGGEAL